MITLKYDINRRSLLALNPSFIKGLNYDETIPHLGWTDNLT